MLLLMWLIKRVLKPIMYKAGKDNQDYYSSLFKWISQTVQGIKEVKISGKEQYFVSEYRKCGKGNAGCLDQQLRHLIVQAVTLYGIHVAFSAFAVASAWPLIPPPSRVMVMS